MLYPFLSCASFPVFGYEFLKWMHGWMDEWMSESINKHIKNGRLLNFYYYLEESIHK